MARADRRTPAVNFPNKEGTSYEGDSIAHPMVTRPQTRNVNQAPMAMLTEFPVGSGRYKVHDTSTPGENAVENALETFMTLPGPWIITLRTLISGIVGPPDTRVFLQRKERDVLPSVYPAGGSGITRDSVLGQSTTIAREIVESYVNASGSDISQPVFQRVDWDDKWKVWRTTYRQRQARPVTLPVIGTIYSTGGIFVGQGVASVAVTLAGTGYTNMPSATVPASSGVQSVLAVTVKATGSSASAVGSGYALGDVLTVIGGTGSATVLTLSSISLASVALNAHGTGYLVNQTITLAGGTSTVKAVLVITRIQLVGAAVNSGGAGYVVSDVVDLLGGTFDPAQNAQITVLTVDGGGAILTFSISRPGSYSVIPINFTTSGGSGTGATFNTPVRGVLTFGINSRGVYSVGATTFTQFATSGSGTGATFQSGVFGIGDATITTPGAYTELPGISLISGSILSGGAGYASGDTIDIVGASGGGAVQVTVTGILGGGSLGPVGSLTLSVSGPLSYVPSDGIFTQDSTSGVGFGFTLTASAYAVIATVSGGSGTGATYFITYGVLSISVTTAGTNYNSVPVVTITPSQFGVTATAAATLTSGGGGVVTSNGYVIDSTSEDQQDSALVWVTWVAMPIPAVQVHQIPVSVLFAAEANIPTNATLHFPTWYGIDWSLNGHIQGSFTGKETLTPQLGLVTVIPQTYTVTTPGTASRFFSIPNKTIHPTWIAQVEDGSYAENITASTTTGWNVGTRIAIVEAESVHIAGELYALRVVQASPDGPIP